MKKLLTLILFLNISLFGASFDCAKVKTNVEKMICVHQVYVLIEGFDYGVTVYLVEKNKITVIGKFIADISIQGE